MLHLGLDELPVVALTRSDRVLDICLSQLTSQQSGFSAKLGQRTCQQQLQQAVKETLFDSRAHQLRWDDVDRVLEKYWQPSNGTFGLAALADVAANYLDFEGDHFAVKANLVTQYQALINAIHPGFLIAALFVQQLDLRQLPANALPTLLEKQSPLGFALDDDETVFADNHVHLGGVHGTDVLTRLLFDGVDRQKLQMLNYPRVPEFTLINSDQYSASMLVSVYRLLFDEFCHYCFANDSTNTKSNTKSNTADERLRTLPKRLGAQLKVKQSPLNNSGSSLYTRARLATKQATTPQQIALLEMVKQFQQDNSHQALTAFACALLIQLGQKQQPSAMQTLTLALIHLVNILRSYVVMSGVGLTHFVDFFVSDIRQFNRGAAKKASLRWLLSGNNKAALKVAPPGNQPGHLLDTARQIDRVIKPSADIHDVFHFCLHFSRSSHGTMTADKVEQKRQTIQQQAAQLRQLLQSQVNCRLKEPGHQLINSVIQPVKIQELVRGFDVAGNENDFQIEVFAPALRFLRDKPMSIKRLNGSVFLPAKRYLSIHAGEDYSHLINGLRHIDETVRYCAMRQGDRIGHALALGVMPDHWAKQQQQAFVTPEQDLWNTVWLLHYARKLSVSHHQASQLAPRLEQRLERWQVEYFGKCEYRLDELWSYWQSRANSRQHQKWMTQSKGLKDRQYWVPYHCSESLEQTFVQIRAKLRQLNNKAITIKLYCGQPPHQNQADDTWVSQEELTLYQLIQDHLMMKYDAMGIVLEVCPSSNISLGRFEQYHQHPVFRWFPPDEKVFDDHQLDLFGIRKKGEVAVCINTDDPGIFPSKIEQEYRLLHNAAIQHYQLSSQAAELWVERLRKLSLQTFSAGHLRQQ